MLLAQLATSPRNPGAGGLGSGCHGRSCERLPSPKSCSARTQRRSDRSNVPGHRDRKREPPAQHSSPPPSSLGAGELAPRRRPVGTPLTASQGGLNGTRKTVLTEIEPVSYFPPPYENRNGQYASVLDVEEQKAYRSPRRDKSATVEDLSSLKSTHFSNQPAQSPRLCTRKTH